MAGCSDSATMQPSNRKDFRRLCAGGATKPACHLIVFRPYLPIPRLSLCFDQLSFWKKPGILCLTCRDFSQDVVTLSEQLAVIAKHNAVAVEERPFQPHITLARKAKQAETSEFEPIIWQTQAFCLVESCSLATGVEYRVLKRWSEVWS